MNSGLGCLRPFGGGGGAFGHLEQGGAAALGGGAGDAGAFVGEAGEVGEAVELALEVVGGQARRGGR